MPAAATAAALPESRMELLPVLLLLVRRLAAAFRFPMLTFCCSVSDILGICVLIFSSPPPPFVELFRGWLETGGGTATVGGTGGGFGSFLATSKSELGRAFQPNGADGGGGSLAASPAPPVCCCSDSTFDDRRQALAQPLPEHIPQYICGIIYHLRNMFFFLIFFFNLITFRKTVLGWKILISYQFLTQDDTISVDNH